MDECLTKSINILIVDDQVLFAENLKLMLETLTPDIHCIDIAFNGQEAIDKLMHISAPDIILLDVRMPVMDGYEAAKAIRNLEERPDGKEIPVIAMTADAFAEDVSRCLEYGMNAHVAKPLDIDELVRTIKRLL